MKLFSYTEDFHKDSWICESEETKYGDKGQLSLVGRHNHSRLYLVRCNICEKDPELYGEGLFGCAKIDLIKGKMPCGCSKIPKWNVDQYSILCKRTAGDLGYDFVGFVGEWKGSCTKVKMCCDKHGEWVGSKIGHLLNLLAGCPKCKIENVAKSKMKPDAEMVESFTLTGVFPEGTKFRRMDKSETEDFKYRWEVTCPGCGEKNTSRAGNLQRGKIPCICSNHKQTIAYINKVQDTFGSIVAIKFGVTNNINRRVWEQNRRTGLTVTNILTYVFPTRKACRYAETECKKLLDCGLLSRSEMPDGWSETVDTSLAYKIAEIYENSGGLLISGNKDDVFTLAIQWFLDSLHNIPQEIIDLIAHRCYVESMERKLAFYEENKDE